MVSEFLSGNDIIGLLGVNQHLRMYLHASLTELRDSIMNQTSFSLYLTKHVLQREVEQPNVVFSPLSMHVVLSILAAGSKGKTQDQLLSFVRSSSIQELNSLSSELISSVLLDGGQLGGPETRYTNSVWIQEGMRLKQSFKDIGNNIYKASVKEVDFFHQAEEIRGEINTWASKKTGEVIKDILPPHSLPIDTKAVIVNALYFKGVWEEKFNAAWTRIDDFHLFKGASVRVPFMTSSERQRIRACKTFKVLGLSYRQGQDKRRLSMYIILPNARDGLRALIERVATEPGFLDSHLPFKSVKLRSFRIPKFKISYGLENVGNMLMEMGLIEPFKNDSITEMVGAPLNVKEIYHKSFIEVDEKGTKAAAVTGAVLRGVGAATPPPTMDFVADHQFLFLIREDVTGVVLFTGRVLNPSISS